ncbi:MAG: nucleotide sugar dehydrogenase [Anaerolineae bacterium]|nr:nucleotide sugar dehydrogenase [Anaerolineae bacterium]
MGSRHEEVLEARIASHQVRVGVMGLGYVGLPLAIAFAQHGVRVTGVDIDRLKVSRIMAGESAVGDVPSAVVAEMVSNGRLIATDDPAKLAEVDAIIICVPTPLGKTRDPDMSYIVAAADEIRRHLQPGQLIVLESTTYPGTTEEIILPRLSGNGYQVGEDFFLAFSPERIDPGNPFYGLQNTPKVLGGTTASCLQLASQLYQLIVECLVPVRDTRTAEMVKLLENTFRAVNIGLVNEVALMCRRLDIDVWEVIEAASTKPYGFMPFYPGPGLGGHCIPLDPHYLAWKMRALNYTSRFIQVATEINLAMPEYVVGLVSDALNERRQAVKGARILVLGVAYKPNVADVRESPAIEVLKALAERGAELYYNDPHVAQLDVEGLSMESSPLADALLAGMDCVVIITAHEGYDWAHIVGQARLIIDTRNATSGIEGEPGRIIKL